ncbi:MAG: transglycosylase SLT domain-containing protein [Prevotella sp.]|jgi:hypothetical protein|nr:transglycosylase SLT domain-containing protein [Prevotella sp.]
MKRVLRFVCLTLFVCAFAPLSLFAGNKGVKKSSQMNWNPVIEAIIQVESEGNRFAKSGNQVGAMQITPVLVRECNRILELRESKKRYSLADRFSIAKSKEMFLLIQSFHNAENNIEFAIRSWNGGVNYSKKATQRYYEKVKKLIN